MAENIKRLVEEARHMIVDAEVGTRAERAVMLSRLVDAVEMLTREMHSRELHHFETEKMLVEAGIDPDRTSHDSTTTGEQ